MLMRNELKSVTLYNRTEDILEDLEIEWVENIQKYKRNWLNHVSRMENTVLQKLEDIEDREVLSEELDMGPKEA